MHIILVVDDDATVRSIIAEALAAPGFTVLTAINAYEAVQILSGRHVDLLVTDIKMPELNGFELARQARLMRPRLHVVYMTGFSTRLDRAGGPVYGEILQKPFRPRELVAKVEEELGLRKDAD